MFSYIYYYYVLDIPLRQYAAFFASFIIGIVLLAIAAGWGQSFLLIALMLGVMFFETFAKRLNGSLANWIVSLTITSALLACIVFLSFLSKKLIFAFRILHVIRV